jgi:pSer/pThr/pTyr-binding forkhead associated (FHA) protein
MEEEKTLNDGNELPLQGPHRHFNPSSDSAPRFVAMRLVLQPGGLVVEVTRPDMVVGRHTNADICLRWPDVSRRHCRLILAGQTWRVFDLQSLNGVFVNEQRVKDATLQHRDSLRIGSYTFEVDLFPGSPTLHLPGKTGRSPEQILESISDALPRTLPDHQDERKAS